MGTSKPRPEEPRQEFIRSAATAVIMVLLVVAVYFPIPSSPKHNTIAARDYHFLHARRIHFAQQALFERKTLPAWYPHELLGTPFWSNIQNFPFIPTRLAILAFDPLDAIVAGTMLSAALAALFTFAFGRQIGMTRVGAAAAGWTFACSGFYASRVMAGHLPLLEAYPALPLLLWRVEACLPSQSASRMHSVRLGLLALAVLCVVLAGHPQLSIYAIAVAAIYLVFRGWKQKTLLVQSSLALGLGIAMGAFALLPMAQLIARSTRVLSLDPAGNDIAFPYARLLAFILPWRDGAFEGSGGAAHSPAYFWDTVCYVGWLPVLATAFLLGLWIVRRRVVETRWTFFFVLGLLALVTALPAIDALRRHLPGTFLRSPARQVYITTFALALSAGVAIDLLLRTVNPRRAIAGTIAGLLLVAHVADLGWHDRWFVRTIGLTAERDTPFENRVRRSLGEGGRIGIDASFTLPFNREIDDVGFFDSIMLAKPYAALMDLTGLPPGTNVQELDGSEMSPRALAATGTRVVMTLRRQRDDLPLVSGTSAIRSYAVPNALPRAAFYPNELISRVDVAEAHRRLRDPGYDVGARVMLPPGAAVQRSAPSTLPSAPLPVKYSRPTTDEIVLRVATPTQGVVRVLESWDPGWTAAVNGLPLNVECADDAFLAVELPPGNHELKLTYSTPGVTTGIGISVASLCMLAALMFSASRVLPDHRTPSNTSAVS
jgi:hypothetical protein